MKRRIAGLAVTLSAVSLLALPGQSKASPSAKASSTHCQTLIGKTKRRDGGVDYKFAGNGNRYFATYHMQPGDPPADPYCSNVALAPTSHVQSGYVAAPASGAYSGETNYWNSPQHFYDTTCGTPESMAAWGGVQRGTTYLLQTGMVRSNIQGKQYSGAFYEIVGGTVQTNHSVVEMSKWDNTLPYDQSHLFEFVNNIVGATVIQFRVYDLTTQKTLLSVDVNVLAGTAQYFGNNAEAVQERIIYQDSNKVYHETQYEAFTGSGGGGSSLFSGATAKLNGTWVNFNTQATSKLIMQDYTTASNLDTPGNMSSLDSWYDNRASGTAGCGTNERYYGPLP